MNNRLKRFLVLGTVGTFATAELGHLEPFVSNDNSASLRKPFIEVLGVGPHNHSETPDGETPTTTSPFAASGNTASLTASYTLPIDWTTEEKS